MQKVGGATLQHYYQELHEVIKTHARVIGTRCLIQTGQEREKCQSRENSSVAGPLFEWLPTELMVEFFIVSVCFNE